MIKKSTFICLLLSVFISCNDTKTSGSEEKDAGIEKNEETQSTERTSTIRNTSKELDLASEVQNFRICKKASEERKDCRNTITKIISQSYNLEEFVDKEKGYVIYDSIRPMIERSPQWENLGAINEDNLNRAVSHTNNGGLALIIDTAQTYGHVVMVLPGETKKSGSWGMALPKVLSLANHSPEKSFHDKTLAYALQKSDDVKVYLRK